MNGCDLLVLAEDEITAAAKFADEAMAAVPADADSLSRLPVSDAFADGVDASGCSAAVLNLQPLHSECSFVRPPWSFQCVFLCGKD